MTFLNVKITRNTLASGSLKWFKNSILLVTAFFLTSSISDAWSYEGRMSAFDNNVSHETLNSSFPSSTAADMCKSLLQNNKHTPTATPNGRIQRNAGKVTALGILLGARFALEPKNNADITPHKTNLVRHNKVKDSNRSAQSIAAYRKCQKEYILSKVAYIK